jgi:hypothetical protein
LIKIIALVLLMVGMAEAVQITGDYVGTGPFSIRDETNGNLMEASGDGDLAYGIKILENSSFSGFDFAGENGRFRVAGGDHLIWLQDATNISARTTIGEDFTWYNVAAIGHFEEGVYQIGKNGRPDKVLEADMTGPYEINSSTYADPKPIDIME